MTEIIAMTTYRTETLLVDGQHHLVRFHKRKDGEEYILTATNETTGKSRKASYSSETAKDFERLHGAELEKTVEDILVNQVTA